MSCTCGTNWTDEYCPNHGRYRPEDKRIHEQEQEIKRLKRELEKKGGTTP